MINFGRICLSIKAKDRTVKSYPLVGVHEPTDSTKSSAGMFNGLKISVSMPRYETKEFNPYVLRIDSLEK